ncbi:sensor histidine kinase [Rathayibacter soli]|uniref:sensor histidine kinase n=1 Tax=Rathayibacter soli TaxID=3144168 RepID=UPI0027E58FA0|nr:histidine kinase [Glaciibacter superstes]
MRVHNATLPVQRAAFLWSAACLGPLLVIGYAAAALLLRRPIVSVDSGGLEDVYPNIVFGVLLPPLGALVLSRLPRHPIGWLFLCCGLASALTLAVWVTADISLTFSAAGSAAFAWVSEWIWSLGFLPLVTLGVLLFPDGRPPGPYWRTLVYVDALGLLLVLLANALGPGPLENFPVITNPLGVALPAALFVTLQALGMGMLALGVVGSVAATAVRWWRSRGTERDAMRWFALTITILAGAILLPLPQLIGDVVAVIAVSLVPVVATVAILRTKAYGIRVVIRRSLVYAILTVLLLLGYAMVVMLVGTLVPAWATQAGALLATALVAIVFAPLRDRLQRSLDRMLFGLRGDPYDVLTGVGRRLENSSRSGDALTEVADTVAASLRLPYARVEVDVDGGPPLMGEYGTPQAELHAVGLSFQSEQVGRLLVAPRTSRDPFRPSDLRLLDDLGRQIGVAAHAIRLAVELQRSREGLIAAREEERRRIRRDLHDGLGPALAGVALGLDAVGHIAAVDGARAAQLASQLKAELQAALADVHRLVEDLRPPALDQLGLVGAVRQQARLLSDRDPGLEVDVEASDISALPAAVEVAAYRITTEALTNVSRHASARHCRVALSFDAGPQGATALLVEIEDDGVGIGAQPPAGVGLTAMRERAGELGGGCETSATRLGGTLVSAWLPVVPI